MDSINNNNNKINCPILCLGDIDPAIIFHSAQNINFKHLKTVTKEFERLKIRSQLSRLAFKYTSSSRLCPIHNLCYTFSNQLFSTTGFLFSTTHFFMFLFMFFYLKAITILYFIVVFVVAMLFNYHHVINLICVTVFKTRAN